MKLLLQFKFDSKLFIGLTIAFIVATFIGTITHEFGHFAMAKALGYNAKVSYAYTTWQDPKTSPFTDSVYSNYSKEISEDIDFPRKSEFEKINTKQFKDNYWITLGGPLQTILTGTIGLILLLAHRKKIYQTKTLTLVHWIYIFLTLFWLRQLANLFTWTIGYLLNGKFRTNGDEVILALLHYLPKGTFTVATALIAVVILWYVIFKIIPLGQRFTFLLAGLVGGVLGYLFWIILFGSILMP